MLEPLLALLCCHVVLTPRRVGALVDLAPRSAGRPGSDGPIRPTGSATARAANVRNFRYPNGFDVADYVRGMRSRRGLLISAPFVVSVLVLAINDHVLKTAWPGFVTGKLSDVAGVVMVALLVTALTGRATIGFWATAIGFAALKTVSAVAMMVTPVLGGRTRTDPTDLIALIVLIPVWFWARDRSISPRDHDSAWLLPLQIVAISAAVFATTATSCEEQGVIRLAAVDGVAYATTVTDVYESNDGGVTWAKSNVPERDERLERSSLDGRASCIGTDLCVEIVVRATCSASTRFVSAIGIRS